MRPFKNLKIEILNYSHLSEVLKCLGLLGYKLRYRSDDYIANSIMTNEDETFHAYIVHIDELNESCKIVTLKYLIDLGNTI